MSFQELPQGWSRRFVLTAGGAALIGARSAFAGDDAAATLLADIEARIGGRLGLAALDTDGGVRLSHRADERFAICSTFKLPLAALVLMRADRGEVSLDQRLAYGAADLIAHAPVTRAHLADGGMTVANLCAAAIEVSDNTAANLLLNLVGGPAGLTQRLRRLGDPTTRLDRNEPSLNTNLPGDPRDTSTPAAMAMTVRKLLLGDALSRASRDRLLGWMAASTTGLQRLRAGLPAGWRAADKTGTGDNGAANDIAVAWPPNHSPILIVSYLDGSTASPERLNAAQAEVGRVVARAFS